jgi:hypothetical protein
MDIITLQSTEVPDMLNLEALGNEVLIQKIITQHGGDLPA